MGKSSADPTVPAWLVQAAINLADMLQHAIDHDGSQEEWDAQTSELKELAAGAKILSRCVTLAIGNAGSIARLFSANRDFATMISNTLQQELAILAKAADAASRMKRRDGISPQRLCALIAASLVEERVHGKWPSPKSPPVHVLCDALWVMATGEERQLKLGKATGDDKWRRHLKWASNNKDHAVTRHIRRLIDDSQAPEVTQSGRSSARYAQFHHDRPKPLRPGEPFARYAKGQEKKIHDP